MGIQVRSNTLRAPRFRIHGGNLKLINPDLWNDLTMYFDKSALAGWLWIDTGILRPEIAEELVATVNLLAKMRNPDDSLGANEDYNRAQIEIGKQQGEEERKAKELLDSGNAQLELYRKAGLQDTERNSRLITEHIQQYGKGVFCAVTVRNAVEYQKANLNWTKVESKPAVQQQPAEPLVTLSDGSTQLPLGIQPAHYHTLAQLKDLAARERAARVRHPGTFGTKF